MSFPSGERTSFPDLQDRLKEIISGYQSWLEQQGLGSRRIANLVCMARHIVTWLAVSGIEIAAFDIRGIAGFLSHDCTCPGRFQSPPLRRTRERANRFLTWLLDTGQTELPSLIVEGGKHVDAFISDLSGQGYSDCTMQDRSTACRHFVVWLYCSDLVLDQIDDGVIRRFLEHECTCSCPHFFRRPSRFTGSSGVRISIERFADFLACAGVMEPWRTEEAPPAARNVFVDGYLDWMHRHRGARERTICIHEWHLNRDVLPDLGDDPASYDVSTIRAAFISWAQTRSSCQLAGMASVLRGYLRYLGANGFCNPALVAAVPSVRIEPQADLPRYVTDSEVEALIASCDTATSIGMRDRAIMLLLARLALRAGDIPALRLKDIDWEQARIRVSGKSRRSEAMPLPQDCGDALKIYILHGRPRVDSDFVFLRSCAPHRALSSGRIVSEIVRYAKERAGIDGEGLPAAHLFRHSRATNLLRGGASLETVATILRHESIKTTTLYARVDTRMLLEVAQPWPEDEP